MPIFPRLEIDPEYSEDVKITWPIKAKTADGKIISLQIDWGDMRKSPVVQLMAYVERLPIGVIKEVSGEQRSRNINDLFCKIIVYSWAGYVHEYVNKEYWGNRTNKEIWPDINYPFEKLQDVVTKACSINKSASVLYSVIKKYYAEVSQDEFLISNFSDLLTRAEVAMISRVGTEVRRINKQRSDEEGSMKPTFADLSKEDQIKFVDRWSKLVADANMECMPFRIVSMSLAYLDQGHRDEMIKGLDKAGDTATTEARNKIKRETLINFKREEIVKYNSSKNSGTEYTLPEKE